MSGPTCTPDWSRMAAAARRAAKLAADLRHAERMDALRADARAAGFPIALLRDRDEVDRMYRAAAKRLHPDVAGGSTEAFAQLGLAKAVLDRHHGRK